MVAAPTESPIWPDLQRARKAIVVVDIVESVRLIHDHEIDVIDRWRRFIHEITTNVLSVRGGRLVKSLGDGLLLEFAQVPSAAAAAIDMQRRIEAYNAQRAPDAVIALRVGVHVSDVIVDHLDVYGKGVNLAARLATLARPGEIVVSDEVRDMLVSGVDADVEDLGDMFVKHLDGAVRAYRLGAAAAAPGLDTLAQRRASDLRPGVAVIPFECTVGHDPGDLLGEALADEVISQLARSAELHVISGLSTRSLKGRRLGVEEIAAHLGAAYILSGRYRLAGDRIRLNVELADVGSRRVLWADAFETTALAAFDPDAPLADLIVTGMSRAILDRELDLALTYPMPALQTYTLLFGAITLMHRASPAQFDRARQMLEHLAYRQGRRGVAHAWLAKWHVLRVVQGWAPDVAEERSQALAQAARALDANPQNSLALSIGGLVHGYLKKDMTTAGRMYADALAANPNEPLAWLFSSTWHAYRGEGVEAEKAGDMALRLSPLDPMRYFFDSLASTALLAGSNWQKSIELAQRSVKANRQHASTWRTLAYALVMSDRVDEAKVAVNELLAIEPSYTVRAFRDRFPGREGPMADPWASALSTAGLPD
jgi:adenylate cyclase